jgi:hypothetical protein
MLGNVPETWRFYEIMENGGIPVIRRGTADNWYRHFLPCEILKHIVISDQPAEAIIALATNMHAVDRMRRRLIFQYNIWRDEWQSNVRRRVDALVTGRIDTESIDEKKQRQAVCTDEEYSALVFRLK